MTDLVKISKALQIASYFHSAQKRKSDGSPYINHLIEVLHLLTSVAGSTDEDELCAAVLHDILEDTEVTEATIIDNFGLNTFSIINALTDDKTKSLEERRQYTLDKLLTAPDAIRRIKLADIISNAASIPKDWSEKRTNEYFTWLDNVAELCRISSDELYQYYIKVRRLTVGTR